MGRRWSIGWRGEFAGNFSGCMAVLDLEIGTCIMRDLIPPSITTNEDKI